MNLQWIVVDYAGRPVLAVSSADEGAKIAGEKNKQLSPWEKQSGYFYGVNSVPSTKNENLGFYPDLY